MWIEKALPYWTLWCCRSGNFSPADPADVPTPVPQESATLARALTDRENGPPCARSERGSEEAHNGGHLKSPTHPIPGSKNGRHDGRYKAR